MLAHDISAGYRRGSYGTRANRLEYVAAHDYWFISRAKRTLDEIPDATRIFASTAADKVWNQSTQLAYEAGLVAIKPDQPLGLGRKGGGARTYKAILESLGLVYIDEGRVARLTLAGEAVRDNDTSVPDRSARAVVTRQVIRFQYPSVYAAGGPSAVATRFRLRPMVLLMRLLSRPELGGYLTQAELAHRIMVLGDSDSEATAKVISEAILDDRAAPPVVSKSGNIWDTANVFINWLGYTELISRGTGDFRVAPAKETAVAEWLAAVGGEPLIDLTQGSIPFQRKYGLPPWRQKDTRRQTRSASTKSGRDRERITTAFQRILADDPALPASGVSTVLIEQVAAVTGLRTKDVEPTLFALMADVADHLAEADRDYRRMAFAGTERATEFEKATERVIRDSFGLKAEWIGKDGHVPDVLVASGHDWGAIIDTKAYKEYGIDSDHRLRMKSYIQKYGDTYAKGSPPLRFWAYIAGGLSPTIDKQIATLRAELGGGAPAGGAIAFDVWWRLVELARMGAVSGEDLPALFSVGRAVTLADLAALTAPPDSEAPEIESGAQ